MRRKRIQEKTCYHNTSASDPNTTKEALKTRMVRWFSPYVKFFYNSWFVPARMSLEAGAREPEPKPFNHPAMPFHQRRQLTLTQSKQAIPINNMLPASRARAVRATLPAINDNISSAQSAQNGLRSAVESLKTLVKEECMCPICLDALTDTRTNPECLHRFCGDCINESLRRFNHECPSCRVRILTMRTLRKDTQFDNIVSESVQFDV